MGIAVPNLLRDGVTTEYSNERRPYPHIIFNYATSKARTVVNRTVKIEQRDPSSDLMERHKEEFQRGGGNLDVRSFLEHVLRHLFH